MDDTLIFPGGALKHVGEGRVTGLLVKFSTAADPDTSRHRDFFTKSTDYGFDDRDEMPTSIYYDHGKDGTIKKQRLGYGTMKVTDEGVWIDAQLDKRRKYVDAVLKLADMGALGWSSGSAPHLVEYKEAKKGVNEVLSWPLGLDGTLTPTPAEPRIIAVPLKSITADEYPTFKSLCAEKGIEIEDEPTDPPAPNPDLPVETNPKETLPLVPDKPNEPAPPPQPAVVQVPAGVPPATPAGPNESAMSASASAVTVMPPSSDAKAGSLESLARLRVRIDDSHALEVPMSALLAHEAVKGMFEAESTLEGGLPDGLRLQEAQTQALAACDGVKSRWMDIVASNRPKAEGTEETTKAGAAISTARRTRMKEFRDRMTEVISEIDKLLSETEPKPKEGEADGKASTEEVLREMTRYEMTRAALLAKKL